MFRVVAPAGWIASHPEDAIDTLAEAARMDGADPDAWLRKALLGAGVASMAVPVSVVPRFAVVDEANQRLQGLYNVMMLRAMDEIEDTLKLAAEQAIRSRG